MQTLVRAARNGTRVIYIPGNHDELARQFIGLKLGEIAVVEDAIHVTADGRRDRARDSSGERSHAQDRPE